MRLGIEIITQEMLKQMMLYNPETGIFIWLDAKNNKKRNGLKAGTVASDGYVNITLLRHHYPAHRLAWFYMTGRFPECQIDHINRIKDDNRFCNLREASRSENQWNIGKKCTNKSGFIGVSFNQHAKKWLASSTLNGKSVHLGNFTDPYLASLAYEKFVKENRSTFLDKTPLIENL